MTIHRYQSSPDKFYVNSFIVEGAEAVVVIDTQFLLSSAGELLARIRAIGKPVAGIIITHPHPDHFNGLPLLLEAVGPVPVHATRATTEGIRASHAAKRAAWTPVYGDDYPATDALPDHEIAPDAVMTLAGMTFHVMDLGPGECSDNTVIHLPDLDALIASDLVYSHCHPWLAEHRADAWLAQLDRVAATFGNVSTVFAGHGEPGGKELLDEQRRYITDFLALVRRFARDGALDPAAMVAVREATTRDRQGWPLEMLVDMNAAAISEQV